MNRWSYFLNVLAIFAGGVPVFFIILIIMRRFFPEIDPYLAKAKPVIAEIDDLLDVILLEWESSKLETVNDIISQLRQDLKRAGYHLDQVEEEKVINHAKAKLKREVEKPEGLSLSRNQAGDLQVEFSRDY